MLVYDVEIINAIPNKNQNQIAGIKYCDSWGDHAGMGVSVIGAYDYKEDRYHVFLEDNKEEFATLVKDRLAVSFNGINFDNKVIKACWDIEVTDNYDILRAVWKEVGRKKGYDLNSICKANFGTKKSGDGAMAPVLWQRKKYGEVIDYCMNDIKMTKMINDVIINDGCIRDPNGGPDIKVSHPMC